MKQVYRFSLLVSIILSMALSGCGAVQFQDALASGQIGLEASFRGMASAVNGTAGTFIYQHPGTGWITLAWPYKGQYGIAIIDQAGNVFQDVRNLCAAKCNWIEAADFVRWMEKTGWQPIGTGAVPAAVTGYIRQISYLLSIGASIPTLPMIFIMPATINPLDLLIKQEGA